MLLTLSLLVPQFYVSLLSCPAEVKAVKGPGLLLQYTALGLSRGASDVLISYADDGAGTI